MLFVFLFHEIISVLYIFCENDNSTQAHKLFLRKIMIIAYQYPESCPIFLIELKPYLSHLDGVCIKFMCISHFHLYYSYFGLIDSDLYLEERTNFEQKYIFSYFVKNEYKIK